MNKIFLICIISLFNFQRIVAQTPLCDSIIFEITSKIQSQYDKVKKIEKKFTRRKIHYKYEQLKFLRIYYLQFDYKFMADFISNKIILDTLRGIDYVSNFEPEHVYWSDSYIFRDSLLLGCVTNRIFVCIRQKRVKLIQATKLNNDEINEIKALDAFNGEINLRSAFSIFDYFVIKNRQLYIMTKKRLKRKSCSSINGYYFYLFCDLSVEETLFIYN